MNLPALRFRDDDGSEFPEWDTKSLDDLFEYKNGKSNEENVIDDGQFFLITLNSINITGKLKKEHKRVAINDNSLIKDDLIMVLSDVAHGNFLGLTDVIPNDNYVLNQRMGGLRAKVSINVRYASLFINFSQKYFKLHGQGSSQLNLSKGDVLGFNIPTPCLKEQTKIANFLTAIDEKISQLTQKHELLNQYKKGVMQKIFSQELRFKDDDGGEFPEWKQFEIGEICKPQQWKTISADEFTVRGYPVYGANGKIGYYSEYNHEHETVAVTCRGATCGEVSLIPEKSYITGNSMSLDDIDITKNNHRFVFYALSNRGFRDVISGSAQPQIVGSAIKKVSLLLPSLKEQTKITNFLTAIDDKITATKSQLELVKQYKQGLLQQMFV